MEQALVPNSKNQNTVGHKGFRQGIVDLYPVKCINSKVMNIFGKNYTIQFMVQKFFSQFTQSKDNSVLEF